MTILYRMIIEVGLNHFLYVVCLYAASKLVHPAVFLVGTSFVHYPRYMTTYFHRTDVQFGNFKGDVLFFKVIALAHVAVRYVLALSSTGFSSIGDAAIVAASLAMIFAGGAVSSLATKALGVDGTYFGPELGMCEMKWVTDFPYNVIPHPMIVGQLVAFAGVHLLPEFRASWPWLMPVHCALYLMVMVQEQFDVHAKATESGRVPGYGGANGGEKVKAL